MKIIHWRGIILDKIDNMERKTVVPELIAFGIGFMAPGMILAGLGFTAGGVVAGTIAAGWQGIH